MTRTYKITSSGTPMAAMTKGDFCIIKNRGKNVQDYAVFVGYAVSDDKPIFATTLTAESLIGGDIYDVLSQGRRILFVSECKIKDVKASAPGTARSGATYAGELASSGHAQAGSKYRTPSDYARSGVWNVGGGRLWEYGSFNVAFALRMKHGWKKAVLILTIIWALMFALTGTHAGIWLGIAVSVAYVALEPEIKEWLGVKPAEKMEDEK